MSTYPPTIGELKRERDLVFAKRGVFWALGSGITWGASGVFLSLVFTMAPFVDSPFWLLAPLTASGMHDLIACCWMLVFNWKTGRIREIGRTFFTKPGVFVCLGALCGGPMGMGGYLVALKFSGPAYVMPITSLYPVVASLLAMIFLKEKIRPRAWLGLLLCISGVFILSYTPPDEGVNPYFYWGLGAALLATFGWGAEGVLATYGMDLLDPSVALNIYQIVSASLYLFILLPVFGGWIVLTKAFTSISGLLLIGVAFLGASSYLMWYRALNMTGVCRAMAMNITYALWGILFSAIFTDTEITQSLLWGAFMITGGMLFVVGNPKDMINLRSVN